MYHVAFHFIYTYTPWLCSDLPGNFEAAFALASFHLRIMLIGNNTNGESEAKKTRTLLLKAAKLDTTKPHPFALLGVWYETQNDTARAKGCYQKALAIDQSHPVAGRGLLRLMTRVEVQPFCENAAKQNSSVNGWAWREISQQKSREEGDDTTAVVCLQQALRCQDIRAPENDTLGVFYTDPYASQSEAKNATYCEASETWAELATCYRQLGKHSAALRAYESAYSISNGHLSPEALCSWAQVNVDLGLYEDAADKCSMVLSAENSKNVQYLAAYTEGEALLFLARNCINEGKFGTSLGHLEKGIERMSSLSVVEEKFTKDHYCKLKLLGDLYSSGSSLPSYVFAATSQDGRNSETSGNLSSEVINQLDFLRKGEKAYTLALELGKEEDGNEEDNAYLIAAAATDLGTNLLSQARVVSMALGEGSGGGTSTSSSDLVMQSSQLKDLITRSINAYMSAVDSSPHEAPAWCGLGCALIGVDPIMSQHAFGRALQIDPSLADSWSNIGLLYTNHDTEKCSEILDYLTQVDDTPLMWIGRGFLLEKTARAWADQVVDQDVASEACLTKAADAYRAALQITQHPAALLGLSLTCRRADPRLKESNNLVYSELADHASKLESRVSIDIHQVLTSGGNIGANYLSNLTQIEEGLNRLNSDDGAESAGLLINDSKCALDESTKRLHSNGGIGSQQGGSQLAQCEIDLSVSTLLQMKETEEFSYDMIKSASSQASIASSSECNNHTDKSCSSLDDTRNNVFMNPESGEAWLMFANKLAEQLSSKRSDSTGLSSAKVASKRAYDLLHQRVISASLLTRRQASNGKSIEFSDGSVVSSIPPASLVSQSMALVSWLNELEKSKKDEEENNTPSDNQIVASFQESLLLDPTNLMAASSLGIETS